MGVAERAFSSQMVPSVHALHAVGVLTGGKATVFFARALGISVMEVLLGDALLREKEYRRAIVRTSHRHYIGETGKTYTSHLHIALCRKRIHTFLDVEKLERGGDIYTGLDNAIESSRCPVVILSGNYASSRWCMDELVQILQCRKDSKIQQIVVPIFYRVNPDDILKQKAGHHVDDRTIEAEFIKDFVKVVSSKLFDAALLNIPKDLVGVDSRLEKLERCVSESGDVPFIGICGFGGLGKTTLAEAYFKNMPRKFEASSFLANIRDVCEKQPNDGLVGLQEQLLRDVFKRDHVVNNVFQGKGIISTRLHRKKILVVLDDVDQLNQLEGLAGEKQWIGDGSQIIVTTRDESLLPCIYGKNEYIIHKVDELEDSEAHQLFSLKAFKSDCPPEDYKELSAEVVKYASGLPLALVVLGFFLRGKTIDEWKRALDRLREYPEKEIMSVLRISFDGLAEIEKNIFLDIACFFNGSCKDYVMNIMDSCGFFPEISIRSLLDKSLLHMDHDRNIVRMHDLLEEMGKEIVREESRNEPGGRSRIWLEDDFYHVLNNETGTEEVEAIPLYNLKSIDLSMSSKIRKLENFSLFPNLEKLNLDFCSNLEEIDISNSDLKRLTSLSLSCRKSLNSLPTSMGGLESLKFLNLSYCSSLGNLPEDLECLNNLEELDATGTGLRDTTPSVGDLKGLHGWKNIWNTIAGNGLLSAGLSCLEALNLENCGIRDGEFPDDFGCLVSLENLNLSGNKFSCLPAHFNQLSKLRHLNLSHCENLTSLGPELPDSLEGIDVNSVPVDWAPCTT
ncbi:hypothetical protein FNV43_RR00814 [Rhamnella rubrinervis]|uniref:TIR domain-containing protein n=1 Tax=Rhamnella rubrinervis TaxID=2594499 RepID=A0A8K0HRE4_9ROSA|nr:hypothetical protein FNV43_RR00814 [Rhamnella rubrinervis]